MKLNKLLFAAAAVAVAGMVCSCSKRAEQNQTDEAENAAVTAAATADQEKTDVIEVTNDEDIKPIEGKLVVIDFNATWCGPCKQFAPAFEAVAAANRDKAVFYSVDVDKNPELAGKYGVQSIPMVVYMTSDGQFTTTVGSMDQEEFATTVASKLPK